MASYDDTATVSGSVVSFSDGADDVPTKSLVVTIPPTLSGVSSVSETQTGRNLFNDKSLNVGLPATSIGSSIDTINTSATLYTYNGFVPPKSNIAIKGSRNDTDVVATCLFFGYFGGYLTEYRSINPYGNSAVIVDCSAFDYVRLSIGANSGYQAPTDMTEYGYVQAEIGSTAHAYEPYQTPTTYTASLGRTIHGGTVDVVKGEGTDENGNDFTFTGQEIPTKLGYNAFWSEQGDTELTYYKSGYGFTSVTIHKETPSGEPVVETAKFHRIVYGGTADVVKGTCEPKNLGELSEETYNQSQKCTWEYTNGGVVITATGTYARVGFVIPVKTGKTYTISYRGFSDAGYRRVYLNSTSAWSGQFYNNNLTETDTAYTYTFTATTNTLFIGLYVTAGTTTGTMTFSELMLEEGSTASEYVPHFEPFSFPPISMETDEGENTLFANEGDSAITYRKAVD